MLSPGTWAAPFLFEFEALGVSPAHLDADAGRAGRRPFRQERTGSAIEAAESVARGAEGVIQRIRSGSEVLAQAGPARRSAPDRSGGSPRPRVPRRVRRPGPMSMSVGPTRRRGSRPERRWHYVHAACWKSKASSRAEAKDSRASSNASRRGLTGLGGVTVFIRVRTARGGSSPRGVSPSRSGCHPAGPWRDAPGQVRYPAIVRAARSFPAGPAERTHTQPGGRLPAQILGESRVMAGRFQRLDARSGACVRPAERARPCRSGERTRREAHPDSRGGTSNLTGISHGNPSGRERRRSCSSPTTDPDPDGGGAKLRSCGFEVMDAPDGEAALELVASRRPDLIVTDLQMPFMSGLDLANKIADNASTRGAHHPADGAGTCSTSRAGGDDHPSHHGQSPSRHANW